MKSLALNREFLMRHLFVTLLMLGLCGWFGYDGYVNYPRQDDSYFEALHLKKDNAIRRQKEFMVLALLAAIVIGGHLAKLARFSFSFDDDGFVHDGKRTAYSEVKSVDRSKWEKKGIVKVNGIVLDAWHHVGVKDFVAKLEARGL